VATEPEQSSARYPVLFRVSGGAATAGALIVTSERLLLEGGAGDDFATVGIPLGDIAGIHVERAPAERLNGHSVIVLERRHDERVEVAPLGHGLLSEISHLVGELLSGDDHVDEQISVVVPLKPGCRSRAQELIAAGPPFDPAALGLRSHQVFLHEQQVVFVFAGADVRAKVERAMRAPTLWHAGLAWRNCIAGRPTLRAPTDEVRGGGVLVYSWSARRA
jgi:hypothetical protein